MSDNTAKSDHRLAAGQMPSRLGTASAPSRLLLPLRILAALGLAVGIYLSILHYQAGSSGVIDSPLCTISATLNCNAVLGSTYARLFKIPIATWAALTYAVLLGVSFMGNLRLLTAALLLGICLYCLHGRYFLLEHSVCVSLLHDAVRYQYWPLRLCDHDRTHQRRVSGAATRVHTRSLCGPRGGVGLVADSCPGHCLSRLRAQCSGVDEKIHEPQNGHAANPGTVHERASERPSDD